MLVMAITSFAKYWCAEPARARCTTTPQAPNATAARFCIGKTALLIGESTDRRTIVLRVAVAQRSGQNFLTSWRSPPSTQAAEDRRALIAKDRKIAVLTYVLELKNGLQAVARGTAERAAEFHAEVVLRDATRGVVLQQGAVAVSVVEAGLANASFQAEGRRKGP